MGLPQDENILIVCSAVWQGSRLWQTERHTDRITQHTLHIKTLLLLKKMTDTQKLKGKLNGNKNEKSEIKSKN